MRPSRRNYLEKAMLDNDLTPSQMAREMGIKVSDFKRLVEGHGQMTLGLIADTAVIFDIPIERIVRDEWLILKRQGRGEQ